MGNAVLTNRERDIVAQLAFGKTNKEIATATGLAVATVKVYISHIRQKDPAIGSRFLMARHLLRDHEREMAIRLDCWIKQYGEALSAEAFDAIRKICAEQVAEMLR